jgi:hypothetical protein
MQDTHNLEDWYTASSAAKILTERSQREVKPDYLRSLARQKKIRTLQIGPRTTLYLKADVDFYLVEDRGKKAAQAAKERTRKKGSNDESTK